VKTDVATIGAGAQRVAGKNFNKKYDFLRSKNFELLRQIRENSKDDHDFFFKSIISVRGNRYD
jgi:hypothetical protein